LASIFRVTANYERAATRHGFDSVLEQIDEELNQLARVAADLRNVIKRLKTYAYVALLGRWRMNTYNVCQKWWQSYGTKLSVFAWRHQSKAIGKTHNAADFVRQ